MNESAGGQAARPGSRSTTPISRTSRIAGGLIGLLVGDALGVPVEFTSRKSRQADPVTGMRGYGTHNQPPGTWSDDSALALCTAASLAETGYDLQDAAGRFVRWLDQGYWTPHGRVFDVGGTTSRAIRRLQKGTVPVEAGGRGEQDNGNGSLMRILPLALCYSDLPVEELLVRAHALSCLTHAHPRSQMACGFYSVLATRLLAGMAPEAAYEQTVALVSPYYQKEPFQAELPHYQRAFSGRIAETAGADISSSGYVVHTLEASLWCLLRSSTYAEAVLAAVNLGEDTDTTGAVTGGLAGIVHGLEGIPGTWGQSLARRDEALELAGRLAQAEDEDHG